MLLAHHCAVLVCPPPHLEGAAEAGWNKDAREMRLKTIYNCKLFDLKI